jgi:hypothetical protein
MRTREQRRRGAAKADLVLFGLALLLLALPLPVLLDGMDLGMNRLVLLGAIVATPALTLLLMHRRASKAKAERPAPAPSPLVAPRDDLDELDEPTMDPDEFSASIAAAPAPAPAPAVASPAPPPAPAPAKVAPAPAPAPRRFASVGPTTADRRSRA